MVTVVLLFGVSFCVRASSSAIDERSVLKTNYVRRGRSWFSINIYKNIRNRVQRPRTHLT